MKLVWQHNEAVQCLSTMNSTGLHAAIADQRCCLLLLLLLLLLLWPGGYFVAIMLVFLGSLVGLKLPGLFSGGEATAAAYYAPDASNR
jgi:hypothetical protein